MAPVLAFIQNFGLGEWLIVILVLVLLFGTAKIPALMRSLGRAQVDYKKAKREAERELDEAESEADLLRRARELGVPTDGRALADVRRDVEAKTPKSA